jgi:hypothetical protein
LRDRSRLPADGTSRRTVGTGGRFLDPKRLEAYREKRPESPPPRGICEAGSRGAARGNKDYYKEKAVEDTKAKVAKVKASKKLSAGAQEGIRSWLPADDGVKMSKLCGP